MAVNGRGARFAPLAAVSRPAARATDASESRNLRDAMDLQQHDATRIVTLSSDVSASICRECGNALPARQRFANDLQDHVNHYLEHGWRILHVGQETRLQESQPLHLTVAVIGRPADLPGRPAGEEDGAELSEDDLARGALRFLAELEDDVRTGPK